MAAVPMRVRPAPSPSLRLLTLALAVMAATLALPARGQAPSEDMRQALPGPAYEAARVAFEGLPEAERILIQDALVWTGDSVSTADGTFGPRTFEAIQAWQRRTRRPAGGALDKAAVSALLANGARAKAAVDFAIEQDPAAGLRIGIPRRLLPKRGANTIGGTRYQSANERATLDTRSQPGGADDLRALYERNLAIRTAGRTITYRLARPDFFVIAGETAGGRFYSRYAHDGAAIRGFSLGYDKALAQEFDRITVAVANSFQPFGAPPQSGVMAERQGPPPVQGVVQAAAPQIATFTGLVVGPRRILAAASLGDACREPRIDGAPARLVSAARGLAILEPAAARRTVPLLFAGATPNEGTGIVAFHSASEGGRAVVTPAEFLSGGRIMAPLQEGAAGGVVLDGTGAVVGMMGSVAIGRRAVAGLVPPAAYPFVAAAVLREIVGDALPPSQAPEMRGSAAAILPALVRIACGDMPAPASIPQPPPRPAGQVIPPQPVPRP